VSTIDAVVSALRAGADRAVAELVALSRIPGVSAEGFDPAELTRSAEAVARLCREAGLENVEIVDLPGAHPYVIADWLHAGPEAPTALLYAHHDVQPPGRPEHWQTPPFEPTVRADGRLYGRGVVDDKAGFLLHLAALRAWLETTGSLPLNVKFVIEGEEETGSEHLAAFLDAHRERLDADVIVLSDTGNLETGLPSITTSLRGLVAVEVTVRTLDHPLHSGFFGGPLPDAATALAKLLARLVDDDGAIAIPGLEDDVVPLEDAARAHLAALPFDEASYRSAAGLLPGARLTGDPTRSVHERTWLAPSLAVTALEGMPLREAANQLMAEAHARVGVRIAPGQDPERVSECLVAFLSEDPPFGARVSVRVGCAVPGFRTDPVGPAFDAAFRALGKGFGREAVAIGCGATIPFVAPFVRAFGDAPALLLGLEDPPCNAHGENESLDLDDFHKATRASALLLAELGRLAPGDLRRAGDGRARGVR
jgi:acetylornithine deacetylase/succinyl-diaminopimelate desuccinylase-like protein